MKKKKVDAKRHGRGITRKQLNTLFKCFVLDQQASVAAELARVQHNTAKLHFNVWRELIYSVNQGRAPAQLTGEFEIDQKKFGGRGQKRMRSLLKRYAKLLPHAQYLKKARELRAEHGVKVIGILQRGGVVYTKIIEREDKRTIEPLVRLVIAQGSTIYTDKWRAYVDLRIDGYVHHSINHSVEYVDKHGHHANTIESFWSFAHRRLTKFNGIARRTLPLHIKECEFRWNHGENFESVLKSLLKEKL